MKTKKFKPLDSDFWKKYLRIYDVLNESISYKQLIESVCCEADIKTGDFVLEAGVGTGNLAVLLNEKGANVLGVDFSEEALELCKNKSSKIKTLKVDLQNKLPFEDNYFDKVVSNNVLYNIPKEKRLEVVLELKRVLKPEGKIVISNLHEGFKPFNIYVDTIVQNFKQKGLLDTINIVVRLLIPVIKIFYYNFKIQLRYQSQKDNLFELNEQFDILNKAGFKNVSKTKPVYSDQGILNSANK